MTLTIATEATVFCTVLFSPYLVCSLTDILSIWLTVGNIFALCCCWVAGQFLAAAVVRINDKPTTCWNWGYSWTSVIYRNKTPSWGTVNILNIGTCMSEQTVKILIRLLLRSSLIRIYTVCHSFYIFWRHYFIVKLNCFILRTLR